MTDKHGGCDLCGLPLPTRSIKTDSPDGRYRFCCIGCRQVFAMLMEAADAPDPARFRETELFRNCQALGIIPSTPEDIPPPPPEPSPPDVPPGMPEDSLPLQLTVDGMWCPACAWVIETALKGQPGVHDATCLFSTDRLTCTYDPRRTTPDTVTAVVARLGYGAVPPGSSLAVRDRRKALIRFGVSAFLTLNVMMLSFGLYAGFFSQFGRDTIRNLSWPLFVMASAVLFYGGYPIYRRALSGLTAAAFGMETLITIGAASAYCYSVANLFSGSLHLYFDTASMLITLVLLGKTIEGKAKAEIREGLEALLSLRPTKVRILSDGFPGGRYTAADGLRTGDMIRVSEGETVPADGVVLTGQGLTDEATLTGEARPVRRRMGDRIRSGVQVRQGDLTVRVDAVGKDSTLGRMLDIIERALASRSRLEGRTDRLLRWFVPVIVALAAGTALALLAAGRSPDTALVRAVTVMVISCPCALGIAIPLTRVAGISLAGQRGLLVRDFSAFESAAAIDTVVFDKTGTLTQGRWRLSEVRTMDSLDEETALALAAGLERDSDHPIAVELLRTVRDSGGRPLSVQGVQRFDNGVTGRWDGMPVRIGSRAFVFPAFRSASEDPAPETGPDLHSSVFLSLADLPVGIFRFGDALRPESRAVVTALRQDGCRIAIVSGDGRAAVEGVGRALDIPDTHGDLLPPDKADWIRSLQEAGRRVAMVGDGVNDAPALVASDLAAAVHSGRDLGREAADIILMRGDLTQIREFFDLAGAVNRKIRQNLVFTFLYNAVAIPVAMAGLLSPLVAVCAMLMSSLSVTGNTLHLLKTGKKSALPVAQSPKG